MCLVVNRIFIYLAVAHHQSSLSPTNISRSLQVSNTELILNNSLLMIDDSFLILEQCCYPILIIPLHVSLILYSVTIHLIFTQVL